MKKIVNYLVAASLPANLAKEQQKVAPQAVKKQVIGNPSPRPNRAPANKFRKTEPGMAKVCLNKQADVNRTRT